MELNADSVHLVLSRGRPEDELAEIVDVAAAVREPSSALDPEIPVGGAAPAGLVARDRLQAIAANPQRVTLHAPGEAEMDRAGLVDMLEAADADVIRAGLPVPVLRARLPATPRLLSSSPRLLYGERRGRCLASPVANHRPVGPLRGGDDARPARLREERAGQELQSADDVEADPDRERRRGRAHAAAGRRDGQHRA